MKRSPGKPGSYSSLTASMRLSGGASAQIGSPDPLDLGYAYWFQRGYRLVIRMHEDGLSASDGGRVSVWLPRICRSWPMRLCEICSTKREHQSISSHLGLKSSENSRN